MNNIYGLIMNDEKKKSLDTVSGLTQFLRYTLYESNSDEVDIHKELQLYKNYIDLESIRLNHIRVNFNQHTDGSIKSIAPLLMIPLIENAFKHTEDNAGAFIEIDLGIANKQLSFKIENYPALFPETSVAPGIGLGNLEKRLKLYYPGRCSYKATSVERRYVALITIESYE
jgi:LytS/YehU family sensor histidine kinase